MGRRGRVNVVIDTNWYISASINRNSRRKLFLLLSHPRLNILYSKELLREYEEVIKRKKFQKIIHPEQIKRFVSVIVPQISIVAVHSSVRISRDINDNFLLALCLDGQANYLITGDPDLLILNEFEDTRILQMAEFMKILYHRDF